MLTVDSVFPSPAFAFNFSMTKIAFIRTLSQPTYSGSRKVYLDGLSSQSSTVLCCLTVRHFLILTSQLTVFHTVPIPHISLSSVCQREPFETFIFVSLADIYMGRWPSHVGILCVSKTPCNSLSAPLFSSTFSLAHSALLSSTSAFFFFVLSRILFLFLWLSLCHSIFPLCVLQSRSTALYL